MTADASSARIFFGDGAGHFSPPQSVGELFGATVADAADFDGDGRTDLVLAGESVNRVGLWRSLGDRNFVKSIERDSTEGPASLATADLDGDGRLDLISASWYASERGAHVDAFLNDGRGRLMAPQSYFIAGNLHALLVARLDRDGRPDVVVAGVNAVSVLHNTCLPGEKPVPVEPPNFDGLERACLQRPLSLRLVDADYSSSLDRVVVASELPSELVILEPRTGSDQRIPLATRPLAVSVAPAARFIGGDLANGRTYAIQGGNTYLYGLLQSFEPEEQWVGVYANLDLAYLGKIPVPCRIDQGPSVETYGRFVFSSAKGDRIYVIATTSTDAGLPERWGLALLDADGRAL